MHDFLQQQKNLNLMNLTIFLLCKPPGWALILAASSVTMLLVGRLFTGFGAGAFCMVIPIYIGEMASAEIRGTVGSFFQQMINLGILYVYALGMAVDVFWLGVLCALIPIIYEVLFVFMPNTPTYLVGHFLQLYFFGVSQSNQTH